MGLLELAGSDFIKAHAYQVVRINLGDSVCLFNELEAALAVAFALLGILFVFGEVELVTGQYVHGFDPKFVVFEEVAFLLSVVDSFGVEGFA